jgi:ABC-type lipoprotein export system ATPase subunit
VDADFAHGTVTAVVGPSGSGKSTLLRLLAGLDSATYGSVVVGRHDLGVLSQKALRSIRRYLVGYVFQRPADNFVSYLTVAEHLRLAARGAGDTALAPDELLDELELSHRRDHLPEELSGGEQQRAALAFTLAAGPRLVMADEPTAELDSISSDQLLQVVDRLARRGVAFVLATHDSSVLRIAEDVVELEHGVVTTGSLGRTTSSPALERPPVEDAAEPVLTMTGVRKVYVRGDEPVTALDAVDLVLASGRLAGLLGRSGSGKTTLLNILFGWEQPDAGALTWLGGPRASDLAGLSWSEVALLPQKFGLIEELTIRENIEYPARLSGRLTEERERVEQLLAELGLEEIADRFPAETSVGEQQRAGLARALVLSPQLLLADEPSGHQDAAASRRIFAALRRATRAGTSTLVATHNEEVASYFDAVYRMANGRVAGLP